MKEILLHTRSDCIFDRHETIPIPTVFGVTNVLNRITRRWRIEEYGETGDIIIFVLKSLASRLVRCNTCWPAGIWPTIKSLRWWECWFKNKYDVKG